MLFIISFSVLFIPIILQYLLFKKQKIRNNLNYFISISLINILLQFLVTITSLILSVMAISETGAKCATGAAGMIFFGFIFGIILIAIIIAQFVTIKKTK